MPIVTPEKYREVLDAVGSDGHSIPAIDIASASVLIAVPEGFSEAESDGITQVSCQGGQFAPGKSHKDDGGGLLHPLLPSSAKSVG